MSRAGVPRKRLFDDKDVLSWEGDVLKLMGTSTNVVRWS